MIEECKAGLTDIVVVKSISKLGRDTVEVLDAINTLREPVTAAWGSILVGVMRTCGNFAEVKRPEQALKLFIRFALAKGAVKMAD
ncbi:Resolvase, N-terminal catalytic domain [Anaerobutyricum hallii]|uniref:Resolvase, N-terminal catalytic domain n=1 Tax=Anaerobutyricum hallii TaxID=39488 RepID=A0A285PU98_9FIRM|nr:Resolvase, N-terminal catalytic domain [Anaerobutyricum hallii]